MTVAKVTFCVGNHTITVPVIPNGVTRYSVVEDSFAGCTCSINLCLVLPDTAIRHTVEVTDRLAFLSTIDVLSTL